METENKLKNKEHFRHLLSIAMADGILDKAELDFLFKISNQFYITREELSEIIQKPNEFHDENIKLTQQDRAEQLYDLVEMMSLDGEADQREQELCMSFGVAMGIDSEKIEDFIKTVAEKIESGESKEAIASSLVEKAI
ncbi:tellurite resistance TerB family protein [Salibacter halophilus]|uniref:TerB family tellurite resistance protein n=1 Tax=Salibacter halophilus TaxID=1803916 RepID=A0A6N6M4R3_9FLAO|nr:hypothetical protein [Salibacter halophilus]KAB1062801.1 hypothetical protein F3059_11480 [Salibacter halophilus]